MIGRDERSDAVPKTTRMSPAKWEEALSSPWPATAWILAIPTAFSIFNHAALPLAFGLIDLGDLILITAWALIALVCLSDRGWVGGFFGLALSAYALIFFLSWIIVLALHGTQTVKQDAVTMTFGIAFPIIAFHAGRAAAWSERRLNSVMIAVVAGLTLYFGALVGIELATGIDLLAPRRQPRLDLGRPTGPFVNPAHLGMVASLLAIMAIGLWRAAESPLARGGLAALVAIDCAIVLVAQSRGAWLGLAIALGYLLFSSSRIETRRIVIAVLTFLALSLAAGIVVFQSASLERILDWETIQTRLAVYAVAWEMIQSNPIWGLGFGLDTFDANKAAYPAIWPGIDPKWGEYPSVPHNHFLHAGVMAGVPAILASLAVFVAGWWALHRYRVTAPTDRSASADTAHCLQAATLSIFVNALFLDLVFMNYAQALWLFAMGAVLSSFTRKAIERRHAPGGPA